MLIAMKKRIVLLIYHAVAGDVQIPKWLSSLDGDCRQVLLDRMRRRHDSMSRYEENLRYDIFCHLVSMPMQLVFLTFKESVMKENSMIRSRPNLSTLNLAWNA